jgi:hypothetical protein
MAHRSGFSAIRTGPTYLLALQCLAWMLWLRTFFSDQTCLHAKDCADLQFPWLWFHFIGTWLLDPLNYILVLILLHRFLYWAIFQCLGTTPGAYSHLTDWMHFSRLSYILGLIPAWQIVMLGYILVLGHDFGAYSHLIDWWTCLHLAIF